MIISTCPGVFSIMISCALGLDKALKTVSPKLLDCCEGQVLVFGKEIFLGFVEMNTGYSFRIYGIDTYACARCGGGY